MTDHELLELVTLAKEEFGIKCPKYAGSVCAEIIKHALERHGISTSVRDVFIDGIPIEIDLLIPKYGVTPKHGLLYGSEEVLVAFEIKNSGSFGKSTISTTRANFEAIRRKNPKITCVYVALIEGKRYLYAVNKENVGASAYTLFWHNGSKVNRRYQATGEWDKMLKDLQTIINATAV